MKPIGTQPYVCPVTYVAVIELISNAVSVDDLNSKKAGLVEYKATSYHHFNAIGSENYDPLGRYWSNGLPQSITDYFDNSNRRKDPVMEYVLSAGRPFWLSDLLEIEELSGKSIINRINAALEHAGDGVLFPQYGPNYTRGYCFLQFMNPKSFYDPVFIWQVQSLLQAAHVKYSMLIASLRSSISLTPRESDVLELITFGKTNPEIGKTLGITTSTVTGYVQQVFLKLDVSDRVSAALRARNFHNFT